MPEMPDVLAGEPVASDWGNDIRDRTLQRYADAAARDAETPFPAPGDLAYLEDVQTLQVWNGVRWNSYGLSAHDPSDDGQHRFITGTPGNETQTARLNADGSLQVFPDGNNTRFRVDSAKVEVTGVVTDFPLNLQQAFAAGADGNLDQNENTYKTLVSLTLPAAGFWHVMAKVYYEDSVGTAVTSYTSEIVQQTTNARIDLMRVTHPQPGPSGMLMPVTLLGAFNMTATPSGVNLRGLMTTKVGTQTYKQPKLMAWRTGAPQ